MKHKQLFLPMLILVTVVLCIGVRAQQDAGTTVTKVGTTSAKFLSIPVGARALGMGGAFTAIATDASAIYWNVAGIARLQSAEAMFDHANWIGDVNLNYGAIVLPLESLGSVGLSFTSMSTDEMERTTVNQPEGTGEFFSVGSIAIGVSYARNLTDWFSIGGTFKYVNEHIWNSSATGYALDIGTLFDTPFTGLRFGAGISNFGTKMQIDGDDLLVLKDISPDAGNNPNINAHLATEGFDLPLTLRIGFAYEPLRDKDQSLTIVADALHPNDNSESINVGAEYEFIQRILSLRAGYKGLGTRDSEEEFTFGGGVRYEVSPGLTAKFDYAFQSFGRLSNVHKFAVALMF